MNLSRVHRETNGRKGHVLRMLVLAVSTAALAILVASAGATPRPTSLSSKHHSKPVSLAGTWSGTYNGAFSGTFKLHWTKTGSHLGGSITLSNPSGSYGINGSVHGTAIKFGAVGAGATYTGKVSGKSMSGNYETPKGGGTWSAHKT